MSYASAKGRAPGSLKTLNQTPAPPLSDAEKAVIADRARAVKEHLPEAWDFMKALHAEGMVDGMRCLVSVTVFEGEDHGSDD
ncbi:MAG: hypothetical protein PHD19_11485 [Dechloromonas sp.]|nr:hypothetical protein [Dechloromonas sp.]